MQLNFDDILLELGYRVGIVDLTKEYQVTELTNILKENGVQNPTEIANKARVYFSYLKEADAKGKDPLSKTDAAYNDDIVNPDTGNKIKVKSALGYDKQSKVYRLAVNKLKDAGVTDDEIEKGSQKQAEPTQNIFGKGGDEPSTQPKQITNNGPVKQVEIGKEEDVKTTEKGAKEINSAKFKKAKAGEITESTISQKEAIKNVVKAYPKIIAHDYKYPGKVQTFLEKVMHPVAYQAMDTLLKLSKGGDFVPPISLITDQFGAGKVSAQMNELCMQAMLAFPNTPDGKKQRDLFIESLRKNNETIKNKGGTPILDDSWIDQFAGANEAFNNAMDREYGKGNWSVVGTTWDVRSQNEDMGINYDDKGFSTDINLQVQVNGKLQNVEISCKKDWKIFLLNGGLGKAENWYYTLGPENEKRATLLAQKAEEKTITKEEAQELNKLNEEALSKAPVSNRELQKDQLKSAEKGAKIIGDVDKKELDKIFNNYVKGNYDNGKDSKGKPRPVDDAPYLKASIECHKKHNISNKEEFMGCMKTKLKDFKGGDKYYKKSIVAISKMISDTNADDRVAKWHKSHMSITTRFIEKAADTIANDKEYRKMILRKLQEAIPFKSLTNGVETMQIDGMYITKEHMSELFGTSNWNEIKQYLDVQVIDGQAVLTYKAKSKKQTKPFPLASVDIREKGGGYDGNPALEVKPTKDFENAMKSIENQLNSRT